MREINDHVINVANDTLKLSVLDEPGAGGANHLYRIGGLGACGSNPAWSYPRENRPDADDLLVAFQNGPIAEAGVNGVTQEVLLAIVIDRLRSFQKGPYSCRENAIALTHIETGLHWLQQRTIERMRRGVEGTHKA